MLKPAHVLARVGICVPLMIVACGRPLTQERERPAGVPRPARHAIHSDRLQAIMHGLGAEVSESWPQEIAEERAADAERDRQARLREAATLARVLGESARMIPEALSDVQLTEAEKEIFMAHVQQLRAQARELEVSASEKKSPEVEIALDHIMGTCTGCHQQFAALTGPVRFGQTGQ